MGFPGSFSRSVPALLPACCDVTPPRAPAGHALDPDSDDHRLAWDVWGVLRHRGQPPFSPLLEQLERPLLRFARIVEVTHFFVRPAEDHCRPVVLVGDLVD